MQRIWRRRPRAPKDWVVHTQLGRARAMNSTITYCILAFLTLPFPVSASLGGDATSVRADQEKMQGTLRTSSGDSYTLHEIQTPTGVAVKEYASVGKVFAV